ncbi:MAG: DUF4055 domain-containing protein [Desulfobacteraceae bacterium]|jgi:hypothetical protein
MAETTTNKHPDYGLFVADWEQMQETYAGERTIKALGTKYLPATPGQELDGMANSNQTGYKNYVAYKMRARFPGVVKEAVQGFLGLMHMRPAEIKLPVKLEPLREKATVQGESLQSLLRRINEQQLVTGRLGLLADVQNNAVASALPYIAMYNAKTIVNWDDGGRTDLVLQNLNLVILDETGPERGDGFSWETKNQYRVCVLGGVDVNEPVGQGVYRVGIFNDVESFNETGLVTPSIAGNTLNEIPFVFINALDLVPEPAEPPLLDLSNLALTIYRGEADYRQNLFMQGQDTFVIIGSVSDDEIRLGAGAYVKVQQGGDAKYAGVNADGLSEQRNALENDKKEASEIGGRLLNNSTKDAESGDALRTRVGSKTSSLIQIALAGALGLEQILKIMAKWVGADPNEVSVVANTKFADEIMDGRSLFELMQAKALGAPLSLKSIHSVQKKKNLTDMTLEEELVAINSEEDLVGPEGTMAGGDEEVVV